MKKASYVCSNCGHQTAKWMGQCSECGEWNTFIETLPVVESKKGSKKPIDLHTLAGEDELKEQRVSSGLSEVDRVLGESVKDKGGSGFVKGSVLLVSGDPGIGKSTLLLQVCLNLAANVSGGVVYVSAEESVSQVRMRARRLIGDSVKSNLSLVYSYDVDEIIATLKESNAKYVVLDSIQTVQTESVRGFPGGISQVKNSASKLVNFAKSNGISMFIVGHINKEGNVAGPKILEHLVDGVFQIEGDKQTGLRIIRALKNRFGATNEVGLLRMGENGLEDVLNPSDYFLTNQSLPGVCKCPVLEGNRIVIVEVQALISPTVYSLPKRVAEGISVSRLQLIAAIVQKYIKINLSDKDIYINVAGGLKVADRSLDLAVACAIVSSYKNISIDKHMVAFGEIALTGNISKSLLFEKRKKESKRLGYNKLFDASSIKHIKNITSSL